jgi:Bacterial PH domain
MDHRRYGVAVFIWVVAVVAAFAAWAWAFRPLLSMTASGLTVQNPLDRVELGWADVQSVSPGYYGIAIRTNGNRLIVARAVQKSNLARWAEGSTRADLVVEAIRSQISAAHAISSAVPADDEPSNQFHASGIEDPRERENLDTLARRLHAEVWDEGEPGQA